MIIDILSWILLVSGGIVGVIGGVGIHRFPDFYSRQHATGITDTLCAMLILLGLGLQAGLSLAAFKLVLIFMFLYGGYFLQCHKGFQVLEFLHKGAGKRQR